MTVTSGTRGGFIGERGERGRPIADAGKKRRGMFDEVAADQTGIHGHNATGELCGRQSQVPLCAAKWIGFSRNPAAGNLSGDPAIPLPRRQQARKTCGA